jgi:hypothetical protein
MFSTIFNFIKSNVSKINVLRLLPKAEKIIQKEILASNTITTDDPRWQKWFPFSFFFGNGKFQPLYAFTFVFCSLAIWMLYIKIDFAFRALKLGTFTTDMISTSDIATVLTFAGSLIVVYQGGKYISNTTNNSTNTSTGIETKNNDVTKEGDSQS